MNCMKCFSSISCWCGFTEDCQCTFRRERDIEREREKKQSQTNLIGSSDLNLSRPGAHCSPYENPKKSLKWLGVWSFCSINFLNGNFQSKISVIPISPQVCCHGSHTIFSVLLKIESPLFFKYFHLRELSKGKPSMLFTS